MRRQPITCTLLLLLLACMLACVCTAAGMAAWPLVDPREPIVAAPPPVPAPQPTLPPIVAPDAVALETEARLRAAVVPTHDPIELYAELAPHALGTPPPPAPEYRIGDRRWFNTSGPSREAELVHVTENAYAWVVVGLKLYSHSIVDAVDHFDDHIYPVVRQFFGHERSPGVDGDTRLSILHYVDASDDAAGYFSPSDALPRWVDSSSNETEMFYINLSSMRPGEDYYFAVLAHEFQHMIQWDNDRNEEDWLDEGLAELACLVAGYDPGRSDVAFFRRPDVQLNHWPYDRDTTPHYGSSYRFVLYLWEQFGDAFIWDVAHHPADGLASLDAVLEAHGASVTIDEVFADWVVVNAVNAGEYAYVNEPDPIDLGIDATHVVYPVERTTTVYPYAADYVELEGSGDLVLRFQGVPQAETLPVAPYSGSTMWWSNLGNRSNARLMRRFDLTGLTRATLRFWTWYELETRYDFVYVSASGDAGRSWQVLSGEQTDRDGDYGPAYNGLSDGWVQETIDLSRYAGAEVWIRFDHVTDDSINWAGFLIDDVSIPELGLFDSCEDEGEWLADGFVLVGPTVPQRWLVQLIEFPIGGGPVRVRRMELDDAQAGEMTLAVGGDVERTLLAISALARWTTEPAWYRYEIVQR